MFLVVILHPLLRKAFDKLATSSIPSSSSSSGTSGHTSQSAQAEARLNRRLNFDLYFALVFLCALNGFSAIKVLVILYTNFALATRLPRQYVPTATWVFNIGILFANELCRGYPFAVVASFLLPWSTAQSSGAGKGTQENWGSWLDEHGGLMSRWEILFNITILRLISFNLDYYWGLGRSGSSSLEVRSQSSTPTIETPRLIMIRRNNLTLQISQNETESTLPQNPKTIASATISLMFSIRRCTWQGLSSLSTTTSRKVGMLPKV